ncbi:hypothetical protein [uncultured Draconibacterium sp.]|uniref:hypothetical protein n=1 Tax=uncultured Draconibacterium sp. TaxID=1573823 RepID=UPI002AA61941|nr:hypothetical protein [uncultured Draconibacterium sp.]
MKNQLRSLSNAKRNLTIDYCFMVMTIIYAGSASQFTASLNTWEYPLGLLVPVAFSIWIMVERKLSFSYLFGFLLLGFLGYFIIVTFKFREVHPRFFGIYIVNFFLAYVVVNAFKQRFLIMYVNIVYYLCIICIAFWGIQVVAPGILTSLLQPLSVSGPNEHHINVIVYTIESDVILENFAIPRNSGFAWEPGAFATFINLAIFSQLITSKFNIFKTTKFWVLSIALLTTMSTTGYSLYLILLTFYAYNQKSKYFVALVPIILVLTIYVSTLPFMTEKLREVSMFNTEELIYNSVTWGFDYRPQRFESLQIDFIDFLNHPIVGYGGHSEAKWTEQLGAKISTVSGIGNLLAIFGIVGFLFFSYSLVKISIDFAAAFGYKGWFFHTLLILMISISYALIFTPLVMCFWLIRSKYLPKYDLLKFKAYSYLIALQK